VLSGRGLCDELITRPEESYRLCCVVVCDLETSRIGAVVRAPDDVWCYHPKHVEQFPDKINCVTLYLVGYILKQMSSRISQKKMPSQSSVSQWEQN